MTMTPAEAVTKCMQYTVEGIVYPDDVRGSGVARIVTSTYVTKERKAVISAANGKQTVDAVVAVSMFAAYESGLCKAYVDAAVPLARLYVDRALALRMDKAKDTATPPAPVPSRDTIEQCVLLTAAQIARSSQGALYDIKGLVQHVAGSTGLVCPTCASVDTVYLSGFSYTSWDCNACKSRFNPYRTGMVEERRLANVYLNRAERDALGVQLYETVTVILDLPASVST